jgi:hypothetical protein
MRKTIITLGLVAGGLFAAAGVAAADDSQTVIVNQSNSSTNASSDCAPASLLAAFPWLPVPACP